MDARDVFVRRHVLQDYANELRDGPAASVSHFRDPQEGVFPKELIKGVSISAEPISIETDERRSLRSVLESDEAARRAATDPKARAVMAQERLAQLLLWLNEEFKTTDQKLQHLLPDRVSWSLLWAVFREGSNATVIHETSGERMGIQVCRFARVFTLPSCLTVFSPDYVGRIRDLLYGWPVRTGDSLNDLVLTPPGLR